MIEEFGYILSKLRKSIGGLSESANNSTDGSILSRLKYCSDAVIPAVATGIASAQATITATQTLVQNAIVEWGSAVQPSLAPLVAKIPLFFEYSKSSPNKNVLYTVATITGVGTINAVYGYSTVSSQIKGSYLTIQISANDTSVYLNGSTESTDTAGKILEIPLSYKFSGTARVYIKSVATSASNLRAAVVAVRM